MSLTYSQLAKELKEALLLDTDLEEYFLEIGLFVKTPPQNLNKKFYALIGVPTGTFMSFENEPFSGTTAGDNTTDGDTETWKYEVTLFSMREGFQDSDEIESTKKTIFSFLDKFLNAISRTWKFDDDVITYRIGDVQNVTDEGQTGFAFRFELSYEVLVLSEGR